LVPTFCTTDVLNLLTNACSRRSATTEGSVRAATISIRAWREKEEHVLEAADNALGSSCVVERVCLHHDGDKLSPLGSGMGMASPLVRASIEVVRREGERDRSTKRVFHVSSGAAAHGRV